MDLTTVRTLVGRLQRWLSRTARSTDGLLLALGGATGLATGLLAAVLIALVDVVQDLAFGRQVSPIELLLVPTLGAFAVGLLLTYWSDEPAGGGIVRTMEIVALLGGRARRRVPVAGTIATGLALGTGASGGREGPIVLIGGGTGSLLGQTFGVDEDGLRTLIAAGAAAGIGASFNAPIGGMLFALEVIVGGFRARSLQVIVVASVIGSVTARQVIGPGIIYEPAVALVAGEAYTLNDPRELLLYALLGLVAAVVGVGFLRLMDVATTAFGRLRTRVWPPLVLALGGAVVGIVALAVPEVLGTGDDLPPVDGFRNPIQSMIDGQFRGWGAVVTMAAFGLAKTLATAATVGSGNAAGTFAPAVFIGATLGSVVGITAATVAPDAGIQAGAFALVGTAAVFAGSARAPLTAILIVFELTGDYGLVLPLMLAAGLSTYVADRIEPDSLYTRPLRKRGIVYDQPDDIDIMQTVRVREVMTTDHPTVDRDLRVGEVRRRFEEHRSHGFAVTRGDQLVGVVALSDLRRAEEHPEVRAGHQRPDDLPVRDIATTRVVTVGPDDPVYRALHRMAALDVGRIPVVEHGSRRLVGVVRRGDIVQAYQAAMARSVAAQQRAGSTRLRDLTGVRFVELVVDPEAPAAGTTVREVPWPKRTVLTSIRRGSAVVVPAGDTELLPGDELVVLTATETTPEVQRLFSPPHRPPAEVDRSDGARSAPREPGP